MMQEKRSAFPRFYFIGDDDLLEILGQATNPTVILSHLKKLFAGQKLGFILDSILVCSVLIILLFMQSVFRVNVCFVHTGIHSVVFDEQCQHIVAMCSLEGETVPLQNLIRISSLVEVRKLINILFFSPYKTYT